MRRTTCSATSCATMSRAPMSCVTMSCVTMPRVTVSCVTLFLVLAVCSPCPAQSYEESSGGGAPKIGLVLGGGGARGGAHIGVLETLEEMRIPVHAVAGTSMGAFVAALYASGMSLADIRDVLETTDWDTVFSPDTPRADKSFREKTFDRDFLVRYGIGIGKKGRLILPEGLIPAQRLLQLLEGLTSATSGIREFDRLPVPFAAVSTDFLTGDEYVIRRGSLAQAVYASMAVPGLLPAAEVDGKLLVDGGIANNLPVSVVRGMGADIIIVVDIGSPFHEKEDIDSFLVAMDQVIKMATRRNVEQTLADLRDSEILLQPSLDEVSTSSFDRIDIAIDAGLVAAADARDRLAPLSIAEDRYDAYRRARLAALVDRERVVSRVIIDNDSYLGDESIRRRLGIEPGKVLDEAALQRGIAELYALEAFDSLTYQLSDDEDGTTVRVTSSGDRETFGKLRLGIRLEDDLRGQDAYTLAGEFLRPGLNSLGGELRLRVSIGDVLQGLVEVYQPLDSLQRWFVGAQVDYTEENVNLFSDGDIITQLRVHQTTATLSAGRVLGRWGELRAGIRRGVGEIETEVGPLRLDGNFDAGSVFARFTLDTFDRAYFPRYGHFMLVSWEQEDESYGSDSDFDIVAATATSAYSIGRNTGLLSLTAASTYDGKSAPQGLLTLGGFLNLSGYQFRELTGADVFLGRLIYYHRLVGRESISPITMPIYIGGSLELGNVWQDDEARTYDSLIPAGSLFLGADTLLGPVYLGGGLAEGGNRSLYLFLGDPF